MAEIEDNIDLVNDKIDNEVNRFLEGVDKSQKGIFNRLLATVKGIETNPDGSIKQTVKNLKILSSVRKTIENEIITDAYIKRVDSLSNQFPAIAQLNNGYFKTIEKAFDPNRELYKEVIKSSINATRASLLDSGVAENVINPIVNIVDNSVTSGATFSDMVDELRVIIKGDKERLGQLMRYSKQITQDALNQFNAGYNETIAKDLDLEWFFYSGGKRRTSRPFCKKYAGRYFHKKEVEDFGRRKDLDGSNLCGGSSKTDLCQGRIKGTNSSNIWRYRAGFNCKHLYKPTLIDSVPKSVVKRNLEKGYINESDLEGIDIIQKPRTITQKQWDKLTDAQKAKISKTLTEVRQKQATKKITPKKTTTKTSQFNAKTIQEAEQQAKDLKLAQFVNYGEIKPDILNRVNETFANIKKKYNLDQMFTINGDIKRKKFWARANGKILDLNRTKFFDKRVMPRMYESTVTNYWKSYQNTIDIANVNITNSKRLIKGYDAQLRLGEIKKDAHKFRVSISNRSIQQQESVIFSLVHTMSKYKVHNILYK